MRASLARALSSHRRIPFLAQPTAGLHSIGASVFDQLTRTFRNALGLTVFIVTHDLDTLYTICDRVAVLSDKHVIVNDRLANVEKFDNPWVQEYFNGPRGQIGRASCRDRGEITVCGGIARGMR